MANCSRCGGLTVEDSLLDRNCPDMAQRCLNCGDVIDWLILKHRMEPAPSCSPDCERGDLLVRVS